MTRIKSQTLRLERFEGDKLHQVCFKYVDILETAISPDEKLLPLESIDVTLRAHLYYNEDELIVPKIYAALREYFGKGDDNFDDFKGAFSYRFILDVKTGDKQGKYLLWIYQYRSFLDFSYCEIAPIADPRKTEVYSKTNEDVFSEQQRQVLPIVFFNTLMDAMKKEEFKPEPFTLFMRSERIIIGYKENQYFIDKISDEDEFTNRRIQ